MTDVQRDFERGNLVLERKEELATIAVDLVGLEDAPAALIGAAMTLWEAQFGYEAAMGAARRALELLNANQSTPPRTN